ncbi:hypothetical protein [Stutzerimonas nitrititolerans]|uniref:hypothetical protein n=1 Tax=Stutzerimonas nitrititolerans TaxID=2482751 RepID=UPI0014836308|nr:hypothetical protein [Stutzerimonas nitrititolerans]NNT92961.1 hypothetical protein [Stutzerimonas nitrititolerans]
MTDTYTINTSYNFKYTTEEFVPIPDVIESLKAMERLIKRTPGFVEKRFDSVKITETHVFVDHLESGSLDLRFFIRFICKTDERTERANQVINELMEENGLVRDVVALGVGSLLTIGAFQILSPNSNAPSTTINAYQSTVIQAGADVGLSPEQMAEVIRKIPDQKTLGKDTFNVLKPATQDKNATIEISAIPELDINRDLLDQLPSEYEAPLPSERETRYQNVSVTLDASDRHNYTKGWAGTVPGVVDSRTKISLDESIDLHPLRTKDSFRANVTIMERYVSSKKKYEVKEIFVEEVVENR